MKKVINLSLFMAMVAINILATNGVLGSTTTKAVSDLNYSVLTPAGISFSIWGLIYLSVGVLALLQTRANEHEITASFDYYFMASCILNIAWVFAWQFKLMFVSFILIVMLLASLMLLLFNMNKLKFWESAPIGLYTGWVNIAMFANLGALLGIKDAVWAILILAFAFIQIMFIAISSDNVFYAMSSCWGLVGIAIANKGVNTTLFVVCITFASILAVGSLVLKYTKNFSKRYSYL